MLPVSSIGAAAKKAVRYQGKILRRITSVMLYRHHVHVFDCKIIKTLKRKTDFRSGENIAAFKLRLFYVTDVMRLHIVYRLPIL